MHRAIAAGGVGGRRWVWRSSLRSDCPVLLALRAHGKTRFVRFALCAQTVAVSQLTKRAGTRAAPKPALLGAPHSAGHPHRLPLRTHRWFSEREPTRLFAKGCAGGCGGVLVKRRGAQGSWPRAKRASKTDSAQLFERRERSERSEFCAGPWTRAPQGSRSEAETASLARRRTLPHSPLPPRCFERPHHENGNSGPPAAPAFNPLACRRPLRPRRRAPWCA
jgi:hypothetical protein